MTIRSRLWTLLFVAALAALMVLAAGCGDDTPASTDPVVFGEGEVPGSVPRDFPIPDGAVIGSTLVDHINNRTEVEIRMRFDLATTEQFFNVELVNVGYLVPTSRDTGLGLWEMEFIKGDLLGTIIIRDLGDVVQAVVEVNRA